MGTPKRGGKRDSRGPRTELRGPQSFKEENDGEAQGSEHEGPRGGGAMLVVSTTQTTIEFSLVRCVLASLPPCPASHLKNVRLSAPSNTTSILKFLGFFFFFALLFGFTTYIPKQYIAQICMFELQMY